MTTKRFTMFAIVMAAFVLLVGCKKEKTENVVFTPQASVSGMLHFNSAEEFLETQQMVLAMSETERREWEQKHGFTSYATKCEELFKEFETKGINSDEDIYNFVKENTDYFYIREEEGEKYLTSYLEYSDYYYLVNENKMVQINDEIIKAFDDALLIGYINNINYMNQVDVIDKDSFNDEDGLRYIELKDNSSMKGTDYSYRSDNGNDRTYARVYFQTHTDWQTGVVDRGYIKLHIRPYHRVLGIWYYCGRHISWDVYAKIKWDAFANPYFDNTASGESHSDAPVSASEITRTLQTLIVPEVGWSNYRFIEIDGWAETPSAPRVICTL